VTIVPASDMTTKCECVHCDKDYNAYDPNIAKPEPWPPFLTRAGAKRATAVLIRQDLAAVYDDRACGQMCDACLERYLMDVLTGQD